MKLKLLIPLLAAAIILSACADIPPVKEPVPKEQQIIAAPPEDGWTAKELMSHSYINDVQLEYPLTMRSLGSGFSNMGLYLEFNTYSSDSGEIWYFVDYDIPNNDEMLPDSVSVSYGIDENDPTADDPVSKINFFSEFVSINGVKYSTTEEDIEKYLGKPDVIQEDNEKFLRYIYNDRESGKELITVTIIKDSMTARHITISF